MNNKKVVQNAKHDHNFRCKVIFFYHLSITMKLDQKCPVLTKLLAVLNVSSGVRLSPLVC